MKFDTVYSKWKRKKKWKNNSNNPNAVLFMGFGLFQIFFNMLYTTSTTNFYNSMYILHISII